MAEEKGSGFGKLVFGVVAGNGYNTDGMSFEQAYKIFEKLGGEENWKAKELKMKADEESAKKENKKSRQAEFDSEWSRMSKALDENDIDVSNDAIEKIEMMLPFKDEEQHEEWLNLAAEYKDFDEFEQKTREIMNQGESTEPSVDDYADDLQRLSKEQNVDFDVVKEDLQSRLDEGQSPEEALKEIENNLKNAEPESMKDKIKRKFKELTGKGEKEASKYKKMSLKETGIPSSLQDKIGRNMASNEVESYKDGENTYLKYKGKNGDDIEIKVDKKGNFERVYNNPTKSVQDAESEMDAKTKEYVDIICKEKGLDKEKLIQHYIEKTKANGSNPEAIAQEIGVDFGTNLYRRNPDEALLNKLKKETPNEYKGIKMSPDKYGLLKVSHPGGEFLAADYEDAKAKIDQREQDDNFNKNLQKLAAENQARKRPLSAEEQKQQRQYWARRKPGKTY